jgi:AAA15 family ATPase/GTPase
MAETTITKRVKGTIIENIFDSSSDVNIRYYNAKNVPENEYDPEKVYTFEIKIRHDEDQDAKELLNQAIKNLTQTL